MRYNEISLKNADSSTAADILANFPPDWDTDALFEKSYRKFRERSGKTVPETAEGQVVDYPIETAGKRVYPFLSSTAAVMCAALVLVFFHSLTTLPDPETPPPDDISKLPVVTVPQSTAEFTLPVTTDGKVSASASSDKTTATSAGTSTTSAVYTTSAALTEPDEPEQTDSPETATEPPTEPNTLPETTAPPTESPTDTDHNADEWGYFDIADGRLNYIRNEEKTAENREYSIELEGFEVMKQYEDESGSAYVFRDISDDRGYIFHLIIFSYPSFGFSTDRTSEAFTFFEINGKPACRITESGTSYLVWDSGRDLCYCVGSEKHLENMLKLAENL